MGIDRGSAAAEAENEGGEIVGWKQEHANKANDAFKHELVIGVVDEYLDNLSHNFGVPKDDAFARYGLKKCMSYAAQVARAQALNIDPDLLRMDSAEIDDAQLRLIEIAQQEGKPVIVVTNRDRGDEDDARVKGGT